MVHLKHVGPGSHYICARVVPQKEREHDEEVGGKAEAQGQRGWGGGEAEVRGGDGIAQRSPQRRCDEAGACCAFGRWASPPPTPSPPPSSAAGSFLSPVVHEAWHADAIFYHAHCCRQPHAQSDATLPDIKLGRDGPSRIRGLNGHPLESCASTQKEIGPLRRDGPLASKVSSSCLQDVLGGAHMYDVFDVREDVTIFQSIGELLR